jgi:hypothetical protein
MRRTANPILACSVAAMTRKFALHWTHAPEQLDAIHPRYGDIQEHAAVGELRHAIQKDHRGVKSRPPYADFADSPAVRRDRIPRSSGTPKARP